MRFIVLILTWLILTGSTACAQKVKELTIKYPITVNDAEKKTAYLYRIQEELRLLHNNMGMDYKTAVITEKEWQTFLTEVFEPKQAAIVQGILEAREFFRHDEKYDTDMERDFEEKIN